MNHIIALIAVKWLLQYCTGPRRWEWGGGGGGGGANCLDRSETGGKGRILAHLGGGGGEICVCVWGGDQIASIEVKRGEG